MSRPTEEWSLAEYRTYVASGGRTKPLATTKEPTVKQQERSPLAVRFEQAWQVLNPAPPYIAEHPVCEDRKWRVDYFWPCGVFCELQGGIYLAGRGGHVAPKRFQNDCAKWNQCTLNGWLGFKLATGQVTPENVLMIRDFVLSRTNQQANK